MAAICTSGCAPPKAQGFFMRDQMCRTLLKPLIVSWGYESEIPVNSRFVDYHEWTGTRDIAAYLAVPAAIKFQSDHDWESVRSDCHELACETQRRISALTGIMPLHEDDTSFAQFVSIPLPDDTNITKLKEDLYNLFQIEVPLLAWNGMKLIRVSIQGYNTRRDIDKLMKALERLL